MTIKITSLFATVTIAGILSMAPFMVNSNQAFAGPVICPSSDTLDSLLAGNHICVEDKHFDNFRNYNSNFDPALITVTGVTVGDEKGLQFSSQALGTLSAAGNPQAIGIVFEYDVTSSGDPISDNTLTLDVFTAIDTLSPNLGTPQTNVKVEEMVFDQQGQIAFKDVFADADPINVANKLSDHVDYPGLHQMVSVNVDIGLITDANCAGICIVEIEQFTQTFSQEPEEPPREPPVGGEFLPIDTTALLVAGAQTNALWILSTLAVIGSIAFGALYLTTRRA